uniref:Potassium channel subfamily K member 18 (inferred by orthology to a human protein) n=1 Tax=Strongyloides venezuelensis TaxID=75913 RepID=A0A0K0F0B4_STRVS
MQLDWIRTKGKKKGFRIIPLKDPKKYINQATPFVVHLLMICGVAVYAIFGAIIMQNLEAKPMVEEQDSSKRVTRELAKNEDNEILKINRHCLVKELQKSINIMCSESKITLGDMLHSIDSCYHVIVNSKSVDSLHIIEKIIHNTETGKDEVVLFEEWSFPDSILFAFTVITTIGYGNVAPKTFGGRMFCIFYGLIGIPFTLLAIADLGKFISEVMVSASNVYNVTVKKIKKKLRRYTNYRYLKIFTRQKKSKIQLDSNKNSIYINPEHVEDLEGALNYKEDVNEPLTLANGTKKLNKNYHSKESIVNYDDNTSIVEYEDGERKENDNSESEDEENDNAYSNQTCSLIGLFIIYIIIGAMMLSSYEPEMTFFNAIYFNFVSLTSIGLGDIVPKSQEYMVFTIVYIAIGLALTTIAIDIAADYLKKLHYFGRKIENVASVTIWFGGNKLTMKQLVKNLGDQFNLPITTIRNLNLDDFVDKAIKVEAGEIETLRPPPLQPENIKTLDESVVFADGSNDWIPNDEDDFNDVYVEVEQPIILELSPKHETPIDNVIPLPSPEEVIHIRTPTPEPKSPTPPKIPTPEERIPTPPKVKTPETEVSPFKTPSPVMKKEPLVDEYMINQKRRGYSEDAWRRYQEYQKQWQKLRQVKRNTGKSPNRNFSSVVESATNELIKNRKTSDITHLSSIDNNSSLSTINNVKKRSLQSEIFRPISRNRNNLSSSSTTKSNEGARKRSPSINESRKIDSKKSVGFNNSSIKNDKDTSLEVTKIITSSTPVKGKPPSITSLSTRLPKGSR